MANRFTPGNVFWRGDWEYCPEYNIGDLVLRGGLFFLAIEHSAGEDPLDPLSVGYWLELGEGPGPVAELLWTGTTINVTFARVATRTDLPITLIPGRLYYIADEGVVLLDMGAGAEEYGGNHGMQYYRGAFATEADLIYAHPTDVEGAYAVVLSPSPTFWVWKTDRWVDTGRPAADFGVPPGRTTGQVLKKRSNADGDMQWANESGSRGGHVIQDGVGTPMPQRSNLQFSGLIVEDDPTGDKTMVSFDNRPDKPQNISPTNGMLDMPPAFWLTSSNYFQRDGNPMVSRQIQISRNADFTELVYDETLTTDQISLLFTGYGMISDGNVTYYWRTRYQSSKLAWSPWSDGTTFITATAWGPSYAIQPLITYPSNNGVLRQAGSYVATTSFSYVGDPDTQASADWQLATDPSFSNIVWESMNDT